MKQKYKKYRTAIFVIALFLLGMSFFIFREKERHYPNILLISIDSLRFDHLGCYGYKERDISPNIDAIAQKGVLFTSAFSQASWTWPSVHSLLTSTYPSTHKIYFWDCSLPESVPTISEILKHKGYYTAFFGGHEKFAKGSRLGNRFDIFDSEMRKADKVTEKAIRWLENKKNKKFFLWIHYMDLHDKLLLFSKIKLIADNTPKQQIDSYTIEQKIAIHHEILSYIDKQIGCILEKLKALGLYKHTIVIITADHGQEMCEHQRCFMHSCFLWDTLIHIPLIISFPDILPQNKIVYTPVQHIDIVPTICDLLMIKRNQYFEGESLLPLIKGENKHSPYLFSEHQERGFFSEGKWPYTKLAIRTSDWKLIYTYGPSENGYELYNLKSDPREKINLVDIEKEQFSLLKKKLEEWIHRPRLNITPLIEPLDEETKARLKSLGYLQ